MCGNDARVSLIPRPCRRRKSVLYRLLAYAYPFYNNLEIHVCLEIVGRISTYMFDILLYHHILYVSLLPVEITFKMEAIHPVVSIQ